MVDALQFSEKHGEVCPAGWQKGSEGMKPNAEGVATYLAKHAKLL
jgi:peroxiredoxin (alkyl hydroperoxide reductase subunit C)